MSDAAKSEQVVRDLYAAYHARRWEDFAALLAPDFRFTSPYDDAIDTAAYRARCWPPGDDQADFNIERVSAEREGPGVFISYFVIRKSDGLGFRNTEYLRLQAGKVASVEVYFGPSYREGKFAPSVTPTS